MSKKLPTLDLKVRVKVKKVDPFEWDLVMNVWRSCMLFFERELRKLSDNGKLSKQTLYKIADGYDFTDLLRMRFRTFSDDERMRLVKLEEVSEALQRVRGLSELQEQPQSQQQDLLNAVIESSTPLSLQSQQSPEYESTMRTYTEEQPSFAISPGGSGFAPQQPPAQPQPAQFLDQTAPRNEDIPSQGTPSPIPTRPEINVTDPPEVSVQEHLDLLEKNTASAVIELRRMMYTNLQKLKKQLDD